MKTRENTSANLQKKANVNTNKNAGRKSAFRFCLCALTLMVVLIGAFTAMTITTSAAETATFVNSAGTEYSTFEEMMAAAYASIGSGEQSEETCIIRAAEGSTGDIIIPVSSTVSIKGDIKINSLVWNSEQRIILQRDSSFDGPMFDIEESSTLEFIQNTDIVDSADTTTGDLNAFFVLDGGENANPLINVAGTFIFRHAVSVQNTTIFYRLSAGFGNVVLGDAEVVTILVDDTDAYLDLQTAINAAESTVTFCGCTTSNAGVYTGVVYYDLDTQIIIPRGKQLWMTANVGSGQDTFVLQRSPDYTGESLFLIEEGATLGVDNRARDGENFAPAEYEQYAQIKFDTDFFENTNTPLLSSIDTPLLFDVRGTLVVGLLTFANSRSGILGRLGSTVQVLEASGGGSHAYGLEGDGAAVEFYYETVFYTGFDELTPPTAVIYIEGHTFVPETPENANYIFRGWSDTIYSGSGTTYTASAPYTVSGAATLYGAWTLVDITAVLDKTEIRSEYTGSAMTLGIDTSAYAALSELYLSAEAGASFETLINWYRDGELLSELTGNPDTIELVNVAESGTYTCEVIFTVTNGARHYSSSAVSAGAVVEITIKIVPKPTVEGETVFEYDGAEKQLSIAAHDGYTIENGTATSAGERLATVTLVNENYIWDDGTSDALVFEWAINKAQIAMPSVVSPNIYPYNANEQILGIAYNSAYTITGNTATNVGDYFATVSLNDTANYEWSNGTVEVLGFGWRIVKAQIAKPTVANSSFVYNANVQTLEIAENTAYDISGNTATVVGDYSATVTLNDTANYEWDDSTNAPIAFDWAIFKAQIAKPTVANSSFVYNANVQTLGITENSAYDISGNTATVVGDYSATVTLNDTVNYEWDDETVDNLTFAWRITKATHNMSGVLFESRVEYFDGTEKSIYLTGTLPVGVGVEYSGNGKTEIGEYTVTAVFSVDSANYEEIPAMSATLTISTNFADPVLIAKAIEELRAIDASWLNPQARALYDAMAATYTDRLTTAPDSVAVSTILSEFYTELDDFAVDVDFSNINDIINQNKQYYNGDTVNSDCLVLLRFFDGDTVHLIGSYTVIYQNGDSLRTGDTMFTISVRGLTTQVTIPRVLTYRPENITFEIENTKTQHTYGDAMPVIVARAYNGGELLRGVFTWAEETLSAGLRAGENVCFFNFSPDGTDEYYEDFCRLYVKKAVPTVTEVVCLADSLTYGDAMPPLSGKASVGGSFGFGENQLLRAGTHTYIYSFIPDDNGYESVSGEIVLSVNHALLTIGAADVVIYEGSNPSFPMRYEGFVNGDDAEDLLSLATVSDAPTAIGTHTVIPSGAASDNYQIEYKESLLTIIDNIYSAVIKDNEDEGTATFDIGDGNTLTVKNKKDEITPALNANFDLYTEEVYALIASEYIINLYELTITDSNGAPVDGDRIIQLRIPDQYLTGYAVHVVDCTNGFAFISEYAVEDGIIAFKAAGNGTFALTVVDESDLCAKLGELLAGQELPTDPDVINTVKALYDSLGREARKNLVSQELAAKLAALFESGGGKLTGDNANSSNGNVTGSGLSGVSTPEINDPDVNSIKFLLTAEKKSEASADIEQTGKKMISLYDISLHKTVYRLVDGNLTPYVYDVANSDIHDEITLYIKFDGDMFAYKNYEVWYVGPDGAATEKMECEVVAIDGENYIAFKTTHFSSFAIVGDLLPIAQNTTAQTAWRVIAMILVVFTCAVLAEPLVRFIAEKKSAKATDGEKTVSN